MNQPRILPFYMTYPLPFYYEEEDTVMRDLEYLQQMYPSDAKKYQAKIVSILDRLDYDGSIIYDEYPDRLGLSKMSRDILEIMKSEEKNSNPPISDERWRWIADMVQVLLFYEIYKRRQNKRGGNLKF